MSKEDLRDAYHTLSLSSVTEMLWQDTISMGHQLYPRLGMGLSVSTTILQQFIDKVFENMLNRERYKIIMDDA